MEATTKSAAAVVRNPQGRQRRLPLAQMLFAVAGVALLVIVGAYALRFVSANAFHKERAFRVLDEIGGQLDNLQRTLANQLRLLPVELAGSQCAREFANPQTLSKLCRDRRENYQRRLALQGPRIGVANVSKTLYARACPQSNRYAAALRSREPGVPFAAFSCAMDTQDDAEGGVLLVAFQGSMAETVEGFVSQNFFDEVLIAMEDGTVIATVPRANGANTPGAQLHPAKVRRLGVADVRPLLRQDIKNPLPSQPEVVSTRIADDEYRVFVRAVQPRYAVYAAQDEAKEATRQERLFVVGLKREDLRAELASSMEPGGRFLLTILTLLAFLIWPLANLRSKSLDDPIAWTEAVACLAAVVLIPAVLAIATVWVWSYQGLLAWVDAGAANYAQSVATTLDDELRESRSLLTQYRSLYLAAPADTSAIPIRTRAGGFVTGRLGPTSCNKAEQDRTCVIDVTEDQPTPWRGWSTFSSVFATDGRGAREGNRYTVYDPPMVKSDASYDNREYFRALQRGEGWTVAGPANQPDAFVAQRLFNGSDGSRSLQVAMPRKAGPNCKTGFCGIVTGSATVHSLAASVAPPLLQFAVIDRNSGAVLFHSNDGRSLAENFFVETERNPELLALAQLAQSGYFSGRYVGAGHRFFHLPMSDAPWSVVVFYSLKEVGDMPWHAVFTALAAYVGAMLVVLVVSCLIVWILARRRREGALAVAARFWTRTGSSCSYARWGLALFAIALSLVTIYERWIGGGPVSLITCLMWVILALAAVAVVLQHKLGIHHLCISLWLVLISAIPAGWMALGYHDVQVEGMMRDALVNASGDIQRRSAMIAGDLRRWLSSGESRDQDFPERWRLLRPSRVMPAPGYAAGACDGSGEDAAQNVWALCVFDAPPLATLITRRPLDFWRRETWDAAVQAETQQRRIRLLGHTQGANPVCESHGVIEKCTFATQDGATFTVRADTAPPAKRNKDDDRSFDGIAGSVLSVAALVLTILITWRLSAFISRRLLGDGLQCRAQRAAVGVAPNTRRGVLFYLRRMSGEDAERILHSLRNGGGNNVEITRVNLATKALYTELSAERWRVGRLLLTNLEIALADASRRGDILDALERLVDNSRVQVLILCRSSPIEMLYHPERYPETGPQHALAVEESLRWDNVLQKFECVDIENMDAPRTHPHLSTVDHHRTWKLCTRSERLLLYELARGRLANPRNTAVIGALLARGLLKLDPWPKIADDGFKDFVRTAETTDDLAQWQQDAAQGGGRRVRSIIIAVLLVVLLLGVVWFSWSAGDKFRIVTAIVAGSVAFLSQIGQAFTFVRNGAGIGRSGG